MSSSSSCFGKTLFSCNSFCCMGLFVAVNFTLFNFNTRSPSQEASLCRVSSDRVKPLRSRLRIFVENLLRSNDCIVSGSVRRVAKRLISTSFHKTPSNDNLYHHLQTREAWSRSPKDRKLKIFKRSSSPRLNTGAPRAERTSLSVTCAADIFSFLTTPTASRAMESFSRTPSAMAVSMAMLAHAIFDTNACFYLQNKTTFIIFLPSHFRFPYMFTASIKRLFTRFLSYFISNVRRNVTN